MTTKEWLALLGAFHPNAPASSDAIDSLEREAGVRLPEDYKLFLQYSNGGEGFVSSDAYVILWRVEELLQLNQAYEVDKYAPGLFLFGSDGGGEALAFDLRHGASPVVAVPFVGMELDEIWSVAEDFKTFLQTPSESWGESSE